MRASHQLCRAHVPHPRLGDVPVVDHVVVVEDHRARHGREQPADVGVAPGLAVELRVLLEVGDLEPRRLVDIAPAAHEGARLDRRLVGVHLVAEQQQAVGPLLPTRLQTTRQRPQRIDAEPVRVLRSRQRVRLALGVADAARAEDQPRLALVLARVDRRRRAPVVGRPDALAVELDLVRAHRSLLEVLEHDERVVVPLDGERPLTGIEHCDLAGAVGLDPDRRLGATGVAEERAEDEAWHAPRP